MLELDCGRGERLLWFAENGSLQITGLEANKERLIHARRALRGDVRFLEQELSVPLPLYEASADVVIWHGSPGCLHRNRVIEIGARSLDEGGELVVFIAQRGEGPPFNEERAWGESLSQAGGFALSAAYRVQEGGIYWLVVRATRLGGRVPVFVPVPTNRRQAFDYFQSLDQPFFNLTANVPVGPIKRWCKEHGRRLFFVVLFCIMRAVRAVPELSLRLEEGQMKRFFALRCGSTVLAADHSFQFVYFQPKSQLSSFAQGAAARLEEHHQNPAFVFDDGLDMVHFSMVPWVHFSSVSHAGNFGGTNSIPKIVVGKLSDDGQLPVSIEAHHALVDGLHIGRFYRFVERAFAELIAESLPQ